MRKYTNRVIASVCTAALLSIATVGLAGGPSGRTIGVTCNGCHGTDGHSQGAAPSLAGVSAKQLEQSMKDFKSGKRPATIMGRIAKGYSDEEIAAVSEYFANMK